MQFLYLYEYSMRVFAEGIWRGLFRGGAAEYAVGSLSQPLAPRSSFAPLPLTSHLPRGLPPADRHRLILPSFLHSVHPPLLVLCPSFSS